MRHTLTGRSEGPSAVALVLAVILAGCAGTRSARDPEAAPPAKPAAAPPAAAAVDDGPPTVDGVPYVPGNRRRISLSYENEEVWRVVRRIATLGEANVVCDPEDVRGRITVNFDAIPWREALDAVAHEAGYVVITDRGGVVHVLSRERALRMLEPPPER